MKVVILILYKDIIMAPIIRQALSRNSHQLMLALVVEVITLFGYD